MKYGILMKTDGWMEGLSRVSDHCDASPCAEPMCEVRWKPDMTGSVIGRLYDSLWV